MSKEELVQLYHEGYVLALVIRDTVQYVMHKDAGKCIVTWTDDLLLADFGDVEDVLRNDVAPGLWKICAKFNGVYKVIDNN